MYPDEKSSQHEYNNSFQIHVQMKCNPDQNSNSLMEFEKLILMNGITLQRRKSTEIN